MSNKTIVRGLLAVALVSLATAAKAQNVDYTILGVGSGTLGGQPFTDAAFTIAITADTAQIVTSPQLFIVPDLFATVTVSGIGTATFTDATQTVVNQSFTDAGVSDSTNGAILFVDNPAFATLDLTPPIGPIVGTAGYGYNAGTLFNTTMGHFSLETVSIATFQAASVPEPATLTLLGAALLGLGAVYLRRRRAKV